jgi:hypothetical protein
MANSSLWFGHQEPSGRYRGMRKAPFAERTGTAKGLVRTSAGGSSGGSINTGDNSCGLTPLRVPSSSGISSLHLIPSLPSFAPLIYLQCASHCPLSPLLAHSPSFQPPLLLVNPSPVCPGFFLSSGILLMFHILRLCYSLLGQCRPWYLQPTRQQLSLPQPTFHRQHHRMYPEHVYWVGPRKC